MTIAAGLKANDAILLCADTKFLTGSSNFSKAKISRDPRVRARTLIECVGWFLLCNVYREYTMQCLQELQIL
jgi:hypothetical protein